jgi:RNA 2',3'-cyclic 3'-phosphodiesterase
MGDTIRTFVAFDLPDDIIDHAARLQAKLQAHGLKLRWVRPQNLHLTLKFLGDIPRQEATAVGQALQQASRGTPPLQLTVQGLSAFPGIKRPRVLWIGVGGQVDLVQALYRKLEDQLSDLGFAREKRGFTAHLTLGRFKAGWPVNNLLSAVEELGGYDPKPFLARRVVLYQSDLRPQGAVYTSLNDVWLDSVDIR